MDVWNGFVDDYIATQGDPRNRIDIEIEVKIGVDGGPLYKTCYTKGCGAIEKRDVPSLKRYSGCGIVSSSCLSEAFKLTNLPHRPCIAVRNVRRKAGQKEGMSAHARAAK